MWSFTKERFLSANRRRIFGKGNHFLSVVALLSLLYGRIKSDIKASLLSQKSFPQRRVVCRTKVFCSIKKPALISSCCIA